MNKYFFRGVLLVVSVLTFHFTIQVVGHFSPGISFALSALTCIGLLVTGSMLWRKHHSWAGGAVFGVFFFYIVPVLYVFLVMAVHLPLM